MNYDGATDRYKYPRTLHLPGSPGATSDDKIASMETVERAFAGKTVVITEKMDGENTTIYGDGYSHARSLDGRYHPSQSMVKALAASVGYSLAENQRICGENLYARHSIGYDDLPAHFLVFSIWSGAESMSWQETVETCEKLGLKTVPVIYEGPWEGLEKSHSRWTTYSDNLLRESEGYVMRASEALSLGRFSEQVFKYVRANHVQTDTHWSQAPVVPNRLESDR